MVVVTEEDFVNADIGEDYKDLVDFLSEDSDQDEEALNTKLATFEPLVQIEERFPSTVVIAGIPKVSMEKINKLEVVLQKKMGEKMVKEGGEELKNFSIFLPSNLETEMTRGSCFVTFNSEFAAQQACRILNNYHIDLKHTFKLAMMDEFDEIVRRDQNYKPPIKLMGFTRENFRWHLLDNRQREQFCLRHGDDTEIYWHDPIERNPCVLVYNGEHERMGGHKLWVEYKVQWSTQGNYLATFHKLGVALWAGENFEKKVRFEHKEVKQVEFSPLETYLITWDGSPASLRNERAIKIWDVMTGELLRQFATPEASPRGVEFPHFLFSYDDKFVAGIGDKELYVYCMQSEQLDSDDKASQTPVQLLKDSNGKCSALKYPVETFEWSPADNILSLWIKGSEDAPGRLILVDIPSRKELSSKNVYNVKGATMHWQSEGDFLCLRTVVSKKTGKKGRKEFTQLEIFRMREKDIPVDNVQLTDVAVQLHWEEGHSNRFALVVQEEGTSNQSLRFYRVCDAVEGETNKRDTVLTYSFEIFAYMNFLKWSPFGSYFILASLGCDGTLMFCYLNDHDKVEMLHQGEHFMTNEIKWSACGRYLATSVSLPFTASSNHATFRLESNSGFNLWTFQGKLLYKCQKERFYQFLWRPHPPSLLKKEKIEEIKKKMKEYSKRYEAEDEKVRNEQKAAFEKQRKFEFDSFTSVVDKLKDWKNKHALCEDWTLAEDAFNAMFDWEEKEEIIEEELDVKQEVIR